MAVVNAPGWDFSLMFVNDHRPPSLPSPEATAQLAPATAKSRVGGTWHEVGHLLAQSGGLALNDEQGHHNALARYGITREEAAALSPYAKSSPVEAIAELSAMLHTPGYADQLDPDLRIKAQQMFDNWGGPE